MDWTIHSVPNKIAHHIVLDQSELQPAGPAQLLTTPQVMRDSWTEEPTVIDSKPIRSAKSSPNNICTAWKEMTGDAGWAGRDWPNRFFQSPERLVILIFAPGQNVLPAVHGGHLAPASRTTLECEPSALILQDWLLGRNVAGGAIVHGSKEGP